MMNVLENRSDESFLHKEFKPLCIGLVACTSGRYQKGPGLSSCGCCSHYGPGLSGPRHLDFRRLFNTLQYGGKEKQV
ncbi:hypothetical protein MHYP_G00087400 [Metynnis hypsauchen]